MCFRFLVVSAVSVTILAGCSTFQYVKPLTEEEQAECQATKLCEVWTPSQLQNLVERAYLQGMQMGRKYGT